MDRVLTIFMQVWVALIVLAHIMGIVGQFYLHGFEAGLAYIQDTYSPYNVLNYIVTVITLLPAIGAYQWRQKRRAKQASI